MDPDDIHGLIRRYIAAFNARDYDTLLALFAQDAVLEDPVGSSPVRGKGNIRAFYEQFKDWQSSLALDGEIRIADAAVAFPFRVDMGEGQEIAVIDTFLFDTAGQIREMRAFWGPRNIRPSRPDAEQAR